MIHPLPLYAPRYRGGGSSVSHMHGSPRNVKPRDAWQSEMTCPAAKLCWIRPGMIRPGSPRMFHFGVPGLSNVKDDRYRYLSYGCVLEGPNQSECQLDVRMTVTGPRSLGTGLQVFITMSPTWDSEHVAEWKTWLPDGILLPSGGDFSSTVSFSGSWMAKSFSGPVGLVVCVSSKSQDPVTLLHEVHYELSPSRLNAGG